MPKQLPKEKLEPHEWLTTGLLELETVVSAQSSNIDRLVKSIGTLAGVIEAKPEKKYVLSLATFFAALTMFLTIGLTFLLWQSIETNKSSITLLRSCTIPEDPGDCLERNQAHAAQLVLHLEQNQAARFEALRRDLLKLPPETASEQKLREQQQGLTSPSPSPPIKIPPKSPQESPSLKGKSMNDIVHLDPHWLTLLVSTIIPIVVGIVTKKFASGAIKSLTLVALSIVTGGLNSALEAGGTIEWYPWLEGMVLAFVIATAAYHNVWKPTGVASAAQDLMPNTGLGSATEPAPSIS